MSKGERRAQGANTVCTYKQHMQRDEETTGYQFNLVMAEAV